MVQLQFLSFVLVLSIDVLTLIIILVYRRTESTAKWPKTETGKHNSTNNEQH